MPRVLIVPSYYPTVSAPLLGTFFRDHAHVMRRAGLDVDVLCVEARSLREFRMGSLLASHFQSTVQMEEDVVVARLHGWNPLAQTVLGGLAWARLTAAFGVSYAHRHARPDVIHAHNALWGGEAARIIADRLGIPFVLTEHSSNVLMRDLGPKEVSFARRVWSSARRVCAVSRALADAIGENWGGPVDVTANPIDTEFFTFPPSASPVPRSRHFVVVANLNYIKRIDFLLQAFSKVCADGQWAQLDVVGDGAEHARLARLAHQLGVSDRVHFLGALDRTGMRAALWRAACFVSSSMHETFGMAVAEALSTGLPVIATRCGGVDETLKGGVGVLVPKDDVDGFAAALRSAPPPDDASRLRRRDHVLRSFAGPVVASRYLSLYGSVLDGVVDRSAGM